MNDDHDHFGLDPLIMDIDYTPEGLAELYEIVGRQDLSSAFVESTYSFCERRRLPFARMVIDEYLHKCKFDRQVFLNLLSFVNWPLDNHIYMRAIINLTLDEIKTLPTSNVDFSTLELDSQVLENCEDDTIEFLLRRGIQLGTIHRWTDVWHIKAMHALGCQFEHFCDIFSDGVMPKGLDMDIFEYMLMHAEIDECCADVLKTWPMEYRTKLDCKLTINRMMNKM